MAVIQSDPMEIFSCGFSVFLHVVPQVWTIFRSIAIAKFDTVTPADQLPTQVHIWAYKENINFIGARINMFLNHIQTRITLNCSRTKPFNIQYQCFFMFYLVQQSCVVDHHPSPNRCEPRSGKSCLDGPSAPALAQKSFPHMGRWNTWNREKITQHNASFIATQ